MTLSMHQMTVSSFLVPSLPFPLSAGCTFKCTIHFAPQRAEPPRKVAVPKFTRAPLIQGQGSKTRPQGSSMGGNTIFHFIQTPRGAPVIFGAQGQLARLRLK